MRAFVCAVMVMLAGGASSALAQERQIGLKAGVNVAAIASDGDDSDSYNRRIGFAAGGFGVWPLAGPTAIQVEALFSQKGAKLSEDLENFEASLELDYLDIPVLLRFQGPVFGSSRLHFFGGPSVSFRTAARSKATNTAFQYDEGEIQNIEDDIEPVDFGILAGAGVDIGRYVVIDARYSWGLSTVNKDTSDGVKIKNRLFSIMGGVRF